MHCYAIPARPRQDARQLLRDAIEQAKYICTDKSIDEIECTIAWDTVDEISRGVARREEFDAMEAYCQENPDADECREYD